MRIALIIPEDTPPTGGNSISARRMELGLSKAGHDAEIVWYHPGISGFDVYHAWNASQVGARLVEDGINPEQIVATWTGTDLWQDWAHDAQRLKERIEAIRYQVTFTEDGRARLLRDAPQWEDRVVVVPPSVNIDEFHPDGAHADAPHPLILMAGGVRPVKRSSWGIDIVDALRQKTGRDYQLAIAGPIRENGEWQRVLDKAEGHDWVHLLGDRAQTEMASWYRAAEIFLNTSEVEGVSNAIMEAMACSALVLATDIRGNEALIQNGRTGLLFDGQEDFLQKMEDIFSHPDEAIAMKRAARAQIVSRHSIMHEVARYERLYEDCVAVRGCCR